MKESEADPLFNKRKTRAFGQLLSMGKLTYAKNAVKICRERGLEVNAVNLSAITAELKIQLLIQRQYLIKAKMAYDSVRELTNEVRDAIRPRKKTKRASAVVTFDLATGEQKHQAQA